MKRLMTFAIRSELASTAPMPWRGVPPDGGSSSHPELWSLTDAIAHVKKFRTDEYPLAVYAVTPSTERRVWPKRGKRRRISGVRL